jgi:type I restriction enzyme S subunit
MRSNAVHFQSGDVMYGRLRPYLNKIYQPDFEGLCSAEFIVLPESPAIRGGFLKYRLNSSDFVFFASHLDEGDRPRVDFDQIKGFEVLLPPLDEQRRIVEKIEELLTDLDAGVAAMERVRAKLKRYRASVLKAAVEGRLTAEWRMAHPDAEPAERLLARILADRRQRWIADQLSKREAKRKAEHWTAAEIAEAVPAERKKIEAKYPAPAAPEADNLPGLPPGWCWTTVDMLIVQGPQNGLYKHSSAYGRGLPIVRIDDYQDDWHRPRAELRLVDVTVQEADAYALRPGDLVLNRVNSMTHLGKCLLVPEEHCPAVFESNMMRMELSGQIDRAWVYYYLQSKIGRQRLVANAKWAVNQASVNQADVGTTPIPLPPHPEQQAIVAEIDRRLSTVAAVDATTSTQLQRSGRLRQSILKRAFEGKLVPQDLADEPADVLLARIRAERKADDARPTTPRRTRRKELRAARGQT